MFLEVIVSSDVSSECPEPNTEEIVLSPNESMFACPSWVMDELCGEEDGQD